MKFGKVLFLVLGVAALVSLGSLISGGQNQKAQVPGGGNSVTITAPQSGAELAQGSTLPMTCQITTAPNQRVWKLVFSWYQNYGSPSGILHQEEYNSYANSLPAGSYTRDITIPNNINLGATNIMCVAYYRTSSSYTETPAQTGIPVTVVAAGQSQLSAPTNLGYTLLSSTGINFTWNAVSGANSYRLERRVGASGNWVLVADNIVNTNRDATGLSSATTYTFRVRANGAGGNSEYTELAGVKIRPNAPTKLTATILQAAGSAQPSGIGSSSGLNPKSGGGGLDKGGSGNQVSLNWQWTNHPGNNSVTTFLIERRSRAINSGSWTGWASIPTQNLTNTNYTVADLLAGNVYQFRVTASTATSGSSSGVRSGPSNIAEITIAGLQAPQAPTGLQITGVTNNSISLSWNAVSGATGYKVHRSNTKNGTYSVVSGSGLVSGTSYTNSGLSSGQTYFYRVSACATVSLCSTLSLPPVDATTFAAPSVPLNVTVGEPTESSLKVSWNHPTTGGQPTEYRIYRNNGGNTPINTNQPIGTVTYPNAFYTDTGLNAGTTYLYRVSAVNSVGASALVPQNGASGTTSNPQITVTSISLVQADGASLIQNLTGGEVINVGTQGNGVGQNISIQAFTNPSQAGSVKFTLQKPNNQTYEHIENVSPYTMFGDNSATNFNPWTDLQLGAHTLTVTPYAGENASGQVGVPANISFVIENNDDLTPPANPTNVAITYRSSSQTRVTWTNSTSNDVHSYRIYRNNSSVGIVTHPTNTFSDSNEMSSEGEYSYKVTAIDAAGNEADLPQTGVPAPTLSTEFSIGANIITVSQASVKQSPDDAGNIGNKPVGSQGQITNGPVWVAAGGAGGVTYWYADFNTSHDGWVNEDSIQEFTPPQQGFVITPASGTDVVAGSTIQASCSFSPTPSSMTLIGATITPYNAVTIAQVSGQSSLSGSATVPAGATGEYHIQCVVNGSNTLSNHLNIVSGPQGPDETAPVATIESPSSGQVLPSGTTSTSLSVTTNESATCKWHTSDTSYANMPNTMSGAGTTGHSANIAGLANGQSYTRYVRCRDTAGNAMQSSVSVTFSVANPEPPQPPQEGGPIVTTPQRSFTPDQVAIIVNSANPISSQIANYYAQARGIPSANIITVNLGNNNSISSSDFNTVRQAIISEISLKPNIQAMAFAGEKPFYVNNGSDNCSSSGHSCMSITSALSMGYSSSHTGGGLITATSYHLTDSLTPRTSHNFIPASVIAGRTFDEAKGYIDQAVASDNTYPNIGNVHSFQTGDTARSGGRRSDMLNVMPNLFNSGNAISNILTDNWGGGGNPYDSANYLSGQSNVIGYHTGSYLVFNVPSNNIVPGALADHVTSFGGFLASTDGWVTNGQYPVRMNDAPQPQMVLTYWLDNGFVMSAGTVQEPWVGGQPNGGLADKFAIVSELWKTYYTGGSALQSFANSIKRPGQTIIVGDLLANPWKDPQITYENGNLSIKITHIKPGEVWKLQSSSNGTTWNDVSGQTNITSPGGKLGLRIITQNNATAPYYRLLNTSNTNLPQIQRFVDVIGAPGDEGGGGAGGEGGGGSGGEVLGIMGHVGPINDRNVTPGANPYGATNYYIACTGNNNDSNNGTSPNTPWATLSRLDSAKYTLQPGDIINLQRGCKFRGMLHVVRSGTVDQPIEYRAYGSGPAPIISGMNRVTETWTAHSGNIWKTNIGAGKNIKYLFVGSSPQRLARHPNYSSNPQESHLFSTAMTATSISNPWINSQSSSIFSGAKIIMRDTPWSMRKYDVLGKSGSSVTFNQTGFCCNWNPVGWGFFFENKLEFLDQAGEWYYNSTNGDLYFWAPNNANPNNLVIEVSNQPRGVDIGLNQANLRFKDFIIEGYTQYAFHNENNRNVVAENLEIRYSDKALQIYTQCCQPSAPMNEFKNNHIHDIYNEGAWIMGDRISLEGNLIQNIATDTQLAANETGWNMVGVGAVGGPNNTKITIRRNRIDNVGYIALAVSGTSLVEENYITRADATLNDGGGISFDHADGLIVRKNIVKDTLHDLITMPILYAGYAPIGNGIYWGNHCIKNTTVTENVIINSPSSGVWWDHPNCGESGFTPTTNSVTNNIIHGFGHSGVGFSDYAAQTLGSFPFMPAYNDVLTGNKIYALSENVPTLHLFNVAAPVGQYVDWGTMNNNYYYQPFSSLKAQVRHYNGGVTTNYTLPEWQNYSGKDTNSKASNYTLQNPNQAAQIFPNPSLSSIQVNVNGCNADGTPLTGTQTIGPFSALVVEYGNC